MFEVEIFGGGHGHLHHGSNVMGAGEMSFRIGLKRLRG